MDVMIAYIVISIAVGLGLFLILRYFWLWYWKIDERTELLMKIQESLDELNTSIKKIVIENSKESKTTKTKNKSKEVKSKPDPNLCTGCNKKLSSPDKIEGKCHSCGTELKGDQLRLD